MSEFHLQARRLVGPLAAPERDDTRRAESDCWHTITGRAEELARDGFMVWVFRRSAEPDALGNHPLRLVSTLKPGSRSAKASVRSRKPTRKV